MPHLDNTGIVADGAWRILRGSGRKYAARLRARYTQLAAPVIARASFVERFVIDVRISRFVWRRVSRLAPPEALYSSRTLSLQTSHALLCRVSRGATRNV